MSSVQFRGVPLSSRIRLCINNVLYVRCIPICLLSSYLPKRYQSFLCVCMCVCACMRGVRVCAGVCVCIYIKCERTRIIQSHLEVRQLFHFIQTYGSLVRR